ncbi:hypothetical protein FM21_04105 [Streptomyces mutabilis]|uniref:Uncharacterized protein n=1 Tax=Streptomyces mutabilis TaxID=67332 RepID=A0A086N2H2_9ACTN|nr:hypothetical protein FM21_04105 [Streptomyces mutabilis]
MGVSHDPAGAVEQHRRLGEGDQGREADDDGGHGDGQHEQGVQHPAVPLLQRRRGKRGPGAGREGGADGLARVLVLGVVHGGMFAVGG